MYRQETLRYSGMLQGLHVSIVRSISVGAMESGSGAWDAANA
jgi:hypothetical protein